MTDVFVETRKEAVELRRKLRREGKHAYFVKLKIGGSYNVSTVPDEIYYSPYWHKPPFKRKNAELTIPEERKMLDGRTGTTKP